MIPLAEAAPALQMLRARMRAPELYTDDLPAAYLRRLYGLTDDTPVISRVDQLANRNRAKKAVTINAREALPRPLAGALEEQGCTS
jgi:hypothetical protein